MPTNARSIASLPPTVRMCHVVLWGCGCGGSPLQTWSFSSTLLVGTAVDGIGGDPFDLRINVVNNTGRPWLDACTIDVVMSGFEALSVLVVVFLRKLGPGKIERQVAPRLDVSMRSPLNAAENSTSDNWDEGVNSELR